MKNVLILTTLLCSFVFSQAQKDILSIQSKNWDEKGRIITKDGKLYSGNAKEKLKGEGELVGVIKNGYFVGDWKYYIKNKLEGYHSYLSQGDTIFAFDLDGVIQWVEVYEESNTFNFNLDKGKEVTLLMMEEFNKKDEKINVFEYEKFENNKFETTIEDYDFPSNLVLDYFESSTGEQEIVIRNFISNKELVKIECAQNKVEVIYLNGDYMENPEDAEYMLNEHFDVSFTEVKNHENFAIHFVNDKHTIFDISVVNGEISYFDKYISENQNFLIYDKLKGYVPTDYQKIEAMLPILQSKVNQTLKK